MQWIELNSTAIKRVAYQKKARELYIEFQKSPEIYVFQEVPDSVYRGLVKARSAGEFFDEHIRDAYD